MQSWKRSFPTSYCFEMCIRDRSSTADGEYDAYSLACLYSEITGDFWSVVYNGCMAALEELKASGVEGYCVAPATGNDYTQ